METSRHDSARGLTPSPFGGLKVIQAPGKKSAPEGPPPPFARGAVKTPVGEVWRVASEWSAEDRLGGVKCRLSGFRMRYTVQPGLYAVGDPGPESEVFASANYKLSFDHLRRALRGMDAWVLVIDTRGINVWCAAGKGTFGDEELVRRIREAGLERVVRHRRIIVPQLGAPGIRAHSVKRLTGFRVHYGPVRAADIRRYVEGGLKATREMRTVTFGIVDRLVLTPMEIIPAMKKYPLYALAVLLIFGLRPEGVIFREAWARGWPFLLLGLLAVFAGAFVTPVLLPFVPFRSFALKGLLVGSALAPFALGALGFDNFFLAVSGAVALPAASSYLALQFTGSTAFTGMSGVNRELKVGLPLYFGALGVALIFLAAYKFTTWGSL
ncbi:MAG: mercury methylation corrinoid protein HgcA [Thermodesulfovibrionales bacterium]